MGQTEVELLIVAAILGEIENVDDGRVGPKKVNLSFQAAFNSSRTRLTLNLR